MSSTYDFKIERGNNRKIMWRFHNGDNSLFNMAGSTFAMSITFRGGQILKHSNVDSNFLVDETESTLTWTPTLAETRLIRVGRVSRYELERRHAGGQDTFLKGHITGVGGEVDD